MIPIFCRCNSSPAIVVLLIVSAISGCAGQRTGSTEMSPGHLRGVTVVLPFIDMAKLYGQSIVVRNPITAKVAYTGVVDEDGAALMTHLLYQQMGQKKKLIWSGFADGILGPVDKAGGLRGDHLIHLQTIGRKEGATTVLSCYLYAFRDRKGSAYGVEIPTQVAFELVLIRVDNGRIIWQRSFNETQKPLSEDLTRLGAFIKRKGRWIGAREMGTSALKEILQGMPASGH